MSISTIRGVPWWLYFTGTRVNTSDEGCKFWGVTTDDDTPVVTLTRGAVKYPLIAIVYAGTVEEREGTVYMDALSGAFKVYAIAMLARRHGLPLIDFTTREPMKKVPTRVVGVNYRDAERDLDDPHNSILQYLMQSNIKEPYMKKGRFVDGRLELAWTVTADRAWY